MKDVIEIKFEELEPKINCLDHGFVQLLDCMPRLIRDNEDSADYAISEAARTSYERELKTVTDDKTLIRYLMRHNHTSPLEMIEFKFKMKVPMYICTQIIRHRTASLNILSGRYSVMPEEFYIPAIDDIRMQSKTNTQGSENNLDEHMSDCVISDIKELCKKSFTVYKDFLEAGVAREIARGVLPYNLYTVMYWKIDLKNLLHFINLRSDHHAQKEVQVFSNAILSLIKPIVPWTIDAWEDYSVYRGGMVLTRYEVEAIKNIIDNVPNLYDVPLGEEVDTFKDIEVDSTLEQREWVKKAERLGWV